MLGQNVNAWHGAAPKADPGTDWGLGRLIRHLAKIDGLERIRFTTSHPRDMDEDLISAFADVPKLMPYLHLPVQSGSDRVLKAMNRGHTAQAYLDILAQVRAARPGLAITSDFIVGFPGETDADFDATMELVETVDFAMAFSFKYSRRPGTPASDMFGQVDEAVKDERLQRLQDLLKDQQTAFNTRQIGQRLPVLVAGPARLPGQMAGRSPYLQAVHFDDARAADSHCKVGDIVTLDMTDATMSSLTGALPSRAMATA